MAISRIRATGTPREYRGALLVNPGGPGGSGLGYAAEKRAKLPEPVQRSFDVIGFDPRGVGRSAPVDCGPAGGLFQHPAPDPVPTDPASEQAYLGQLRHLAGDCVRHVGDVLPHVSTANTARDMDVIREALGKRELNFLGVSYGTYLGAAYAAQFPGGPAGWCSTAS
ncbi:alpha/beta fold hydrolase [Saccharopolyspora spinosporotrichia]